MPLWDPLLAATPTGGPSLIRRPFGIFANSTPHIMNISNGIWGATGTSVNLPIQGQLIDFNNTVSDNSPVDWISLAFIRGIFLKVTENNYNVDVDFVLFRNGTLFKNLFTIPAGAAGEQPYKTENFLPLQNGESWSYGLIAPSVPTGNMIFTCTTNIQYAQGNPTVPPSGDENEVIVTSGERNHGGLANQPLTRICPMTNFSGSFGNEGEERIFTVYRKMFLQKWIFQQISRNGNLQTLTVRFLINGTVAFTLAIDIDDFTVHEVPLTVETFPGSGTFVPILVDVDDTIGYLVDSWAGEVTLPRRRFIQTFYAELL